MTRITDTIHERVLDEVDTETPLRLKVAGVFLYLVTEERGYILLDKNELTEKKTK